jgi:hypothetical protein
VISREMRLPGAVIAEVARADRSTVEKRYSRDDTGMYVGTNVSIFRLGCCGGRCSLFSFQTTTFYILSYRLSDPHLSVFPTAPHVEDLRICAPWRPAKLLIRFRWMVNIEASVWYSVGENSVKTICFLWQIPLKIS